MFTKPLGTITRTYRHMQRYREIARVLLKYHLIDLLNKLGLDKYLPRSRQELEEPGDIASRYERMRKAFEELGPTFIKLGQFLSTRPDLFPEPLIQELEKLQDTVPPFSYEEVREIVEAEFGRSLEEIFTEFEHQPQASASIAQVHKAVNAAGELLAVKVRRPGLREVIETDLELLHDLAQLAEGHVQGAASFAPVRTVEEFARVIRRELDFATEAANIERFTQMFEGDSRVRIPRVYRLLTTERVLTMEYIHGAKIREIMRKGTDGDRELLAARGAELIFEQVFNHGFFHADPHPGNILICPGNVICFLDYGMMGVLSVRHREQLGVLLEGLVARDERRITTAVFRLSGYKQYENTVEIETEVANFIQNRLYRPLREIKIGEIINELSRLLVRYGIRLPTDFFLLTKAVTTIEGVGRVLSPDFDVMEHAEPFVRRIAQNRTNLHYVAHELHFFLLDLKSLLRDLPSDTREILTLIKHGDVRVKFEHRGLEDLIRTNDQISNRVVFAIVLAALLIGSSLMTLSGIPPKWHEIPLIGLGGFVISGLMAFYLLWSILRHGRM